MKCKQPFRAALNATVFVGSIAFALLSTKGAIADENCSGEIAPLGFEQSTLERNDVIDVSPQPVDIYAEMDRIFMKKWNKAKAANNEVDMSYYIDLTVEYNDASYLAAK